MTNKIPTEKENEIIENFNTKEKEDIYDLGFKRGFQAGQKQEREKVLKILDIFQDDSIYSGKIVKFEIKNRLYQKEEVKPIILDDNPLSIACYMEEHPEVSFEKEKEGDKGE